MLQCPICTHAQREAIEDSMANGGSLRGVAQQYGLSKDTVARHRKHMQVKADPLYEPVPFCPVHGDVLVRWSGTEWLCGKCHPWDGMLAYWKSPVESIPSEASAQ